jgi:divinyl protochlorophyllide a 8-vinyl-reductase
MRAILCEANLESVLESPPGAMVPEDDVIALHRTVRRQLGQDAARAVMVAAGLGTANYLLANRIPALAQSVLRLLPARLASRALLAAIARHTWTFAGSGQVTFRPGRPVVVTIHHCPACRGESSASALCDYYSATFERLYGVLVDRRASVRETTCIARGDGECRFEIGWCPERVRA